MALPIWYWVVDMVESTGEDREEEPAAKSKLRPFQHLIASFHLEVVPIETKDSTRQQ